MVIRCRNQLNKHTKSLASNVQRHLEIERTNKQMVYHVETIQVQFLCVLKALSDGKRLEVFHGQLFHRKSPCSV